MGDFDVVGPALAYGDAAPEVWVALPLIEQLRRLRLRFGLNQKRWAAAAGVDPSVVCRAEFGADLRWSTLVRLYAGVGCEPLIVPRGGLAALRLLDAHRDALWEDFLRAERLRNRQVDCGRTQST